jgi:hypothetical protein
MVTRCLRSHALRLFALLVFASAATAAGACDAELLVGVNVDAFNPKGRPGLPDLLRAGAKICRFEFKHASPSGPIPDATFATMEAAAKGLSHARIRVLFIIDHATATPVPWGQHQPQRVAGLHQPVGRASAADFEVLRQRAAGCSLRNMEGGGPERSVSAAARALASPAPTSCHIALLPLLSRHSYGLWASLR